MLTIKHVCDDGHEAIVSVISVRFDPDGNKLIGCGANEVMISCHEGGHAWVMNDNGKTVASYNLRAPQKQKLMLQEQLT